MGRGRSARRLNLPDTDHQSASVHPGAFSLRRADGTVTIIASAFRRDTSPECPPSFRSDFHSLRAKNRIFEPSQTSPMSTASPTYALVCIVTKRPMATMLLPKRPEPMLRGLPLPCHAETRDSVSHTRNMNVYGPHSDNQNGRSSTPETTSNNERTSCMALSNPASMPPINRTGFQICGLRTGP